MINYRRIKSDLERTSCSIHNQHPEVNVIGDKINFKCCCEDFRSKSLKKLEGLLANEAQKSILDAFKGFK